jgi:hypothetical protein
MNRSAASPTPVRAARTPSACTTTPAQQAIKQVASGRFGVTSRVPGQRRRHPDQDGAGRQARRGRPAARPQGVPVGRQDPALHAGRRAHLAAAAPRHLLDRRPRAAHPRPQERQPARRASTSSSSPEVGSARWPPGVSQGPRRRRPDLRARRRHRGLAAHLAQARRGSVGARPRRDPADPAAQRPARPHRGADRRPAEDRARRRHRRAARRRGVRLRHRAAGGLRLHHDARLPPRHLPGGRGHAEPRAAQALHRPARVRRHLLRVHRRGGARVPGRARLPQPRRGHRARRDARHRPCRGALEGGRARPHADPARPRPAGGPTAPDHRAGPRPGQGARQRAHRAQPPTPSTTASPSGPRCRSATSTGRSARCSATRSPSRYGARGCPTARSTSPSPARPASRSAPSCPAASLCVWKATRTTTSARVCPAGASCVRPDRSAPFVAEENVIAGNVIAYGATAGEIFVRGSRRRALLRAQLRRHGRRRGRRRPRVRVHDRRAVVILGPTGRNVAAGMSGGIAYVLDLDPAGQPRDGRPRRR